MRVYEIYNEEINHSATITEIMLEKKMKIKGLMIDKEIGKGTFATVYICRKQYSRKKFAAKVIEYKDDRRIQWDAENEVEVLQELKDSPHIVALHGVNREEGKITCVLEYIPGSQFLEGIFNWPLFNENSVKVVMKQLLSALAFCAFKRVIHRDVCPENLMWFEVPTKRKSSTLPLLKMIDFNLARKMGESEEYLKTEAYGNPSYMAPETLEEEPIACYKTDVWSAAVILFQLLGGYPPFWNDNYNHLIENILEANYVLPDEHWGHVSTEGTSVLKKMFTKDFRTRPSAEDMLSDSWFQSRSPSAPLPSTLKLQSFLLYIKEQRKKTTHRRYTLSDMERSPFVPKEEMFKYVDEIRAKNEVIVNLDSPSVNKEQFSDMQKIRSLRNKNDFSNLSESTSQSNKSTTIIRRRKNSSTLNRTPSLRKGNGLNRTPSIRKSTEDIRNISRLVHKFERLSYHEDDNNNMMDDVFG